MNSVELWLLCHRLVESFFRSQFLVIIKAIVGKALGIQVLGKNYNSKSEKMHLLQWSVMTLN